MSSNHRRDRIARVASARDASGTTPVRRGFLTYWVTRDSVDGVAASTVRVWLRCPTRSEAELIYPEHSHARTWSAWREDGASALYAEWSLEHALAITGTIPDDDRQCIRREGWGGIGWAP